MLVKVLKPFPYAPDVRSMVTFEVGDVVEIDDEVAPGLYAEGLIDEPSDAEAAIAAAPETVVLQELVELPEDWRKLHWFELKPLAERLLGVKIAKKAQAVSMIEAELARRAGQG